MTWFAHPARERPLHAVTAGVSIIAMSILSGILMQGTIWAGAALVVQVLILNRFFFPSQFSIDESGITARHPLRRQRLEWAGLRRFVCDERGGFLSSRAHFSRWDGIGSRSMHVLFGRDRERIVPAIRSRLNPATQGGVACAH